MGVARALAFCCLAFHPSSLPLPLFWSWSGTLTTSLYTPFSPPIPALSCALSLPSLASLSFLPYTTSAYSVPSTRFTFHSFFVLAHRPVTSAYPDACGYQNPPDHNTFIHSPGVQVCAEHSFSRFSNHTVLASWHPLHPSMLHAACRSTIICCARVTNV